MKTILKSNKVLHWPTLNTVIMVEKEIKDFDDSVISVAELKKNLPRQVNHNTLMLILRYLEESNKIVFTSRGVSWIHNPDPHLRKAISKGLQI